jgi:flagellar biosynthesis/type III secretory pathway M-ring protein FliF/YscJ
MSPITHPVAVQLRAMNIVYETKERGVTMLMPRSMVDSMNPSVASAPLALARQGLREPEMVGRPPAA